MSNLARIGLAAAAVVVAVVLFVVLRDGDDGEEAVPATTSAVATSQPGETETGVATETGSNASPPPAPPAPRPLRVDVPAGGPNRIQRFDLEQGERVVLVVRAATSDEVHLHGYDLSANVAPGRVARIRFTADLPGRFEIELEDAGEPIAELRVAP